MGINKQTSYVLLIFLVIILLPEITILCGLMFLRKRVVDTVKSL